MNEHTKYDPEDIEKLLRNKTFEELLDKERQFVNNHISSEDEYNQMRLFLLNLEDQEWEEAPEPPKSIKVDLMAKHKRANKKGFQVWLNSLFAADNHNLSWYQKPAFQVGFASLMVVGSIFFLTQNNDLDKPLAELHQKPKTEEVTAPSVSSQPKDELKNEVGDAKNIEPLADKDLPITESTEDSEPIAPPAIAEIQEEIITIEKEMQEIPFPEEQDMSDISVVEVIDMVTDDVEITEDSKSNNTLENSNFGNDKDLSSEPRKTDSEGELAVEKQEIIEKDEEAPTVTRNHDGYLDETIETPVAQELGTLMDSNLERADESISENSKKRTASNISISSVCLEEQPEIIDQLFTAY